MSFERIVSLAASTTAILFELGAGDRVCAVTRDCPRLTPQSQDRPQVGDCWTATSAEVLALDPDLVVGAAPYDPDTVAALIRDRCRFVATSPWSLNDVYRDVRMLGLLVEAAKGAETLVQRMQTRIEEVRDRTRGVARPSVYCEVWMKPVMSSPVWVHELIESAGGEPAVPPASVLDADAILRADPDFIVMAWCGAIGRSRPAKLSARPGHDKLRAVLENRVIPVRDEYLNAPCQHLLTGLDILAHCIHPELFGPLPQHLRVPQP